MACISRGLRHKNPVKTNTKSTFYVADFEDLGAGKHDSPELFMGPYCSDLQHFKSKSCDFMLFFETSFSS